MRKIIILLVIHLIACQAQQVPEELKADSGAIPNETAAPSADIVASDPFLEGLLQANRSVDDVIKQVKREHRKKNPPKIDPKIIASLNLEEGQGTGKVLYIDSENRVHKDLTSGPIELEKSSQRELGNNSTNNRTNGTATSNATEQDATFLVKRQLQGPEGPANYVIQKEYDIDYYYRPLPTTNYPPCEMPGITSSVCVPKEVVEESTEFCFEVNYPTICVPVEHFLWPLWTIDEKDFQINTLVAGQVEKRLLLELAQPLGEESAPVANLELTTSTDCLDGYRQFTCRYNFPYCDGETGEIFKACPAECIFFNQSCGMKSNQCNEKFFKFMTDETAACEFAPEIEEEEEEEEE